MERRLGKIIIHAAGGTAAKGASTYKLTLPSAWIKEMGVSPDCREVELSFDGSTISVARRMTAEEFTAANLVKGHSLSRLRYYDGETPCTTIIADETAQMLCVQNHVDNVVKTAFGNNPAPSWTDFQQFLEERCVPRARAGLRDYLDTIGVDGYDPAQIVKKTEGRMAEDDQWISWEVLG